MIFLETIDGKDVQENTRTFLKNFDQEKKHNHFRQDSKISNFQSLSGKLLSFSSWLVTNLHFLAPIINRFPPDLKPDVKKSTKFTNGPKLDGAICLSQIEPPSKLHDSSIKPYPSFATIDVSCVEEELFLPWNKRKIKFINSHCSSRVSPLLTYTSKKICKSIGEPVSWLAAILNLK